MANHDVDLMAQKAEELLARNIPAEAERKDIDPVISQLRAVRESFYDLQEQASGETHRQIEEILGRVSARIRDLSNKWNAAGDAATRGKKSAIEATPAGKVVDAMKFFPLPRSTEWGFSSYIYEQLERLERSVNGNSLLDVYDGVVKLAILFLEGKRLEPASSDPIYTFAHIASDIIRANDDGDREQLRILAKQVVESWNKMS